MTEATNMQEAIMQPVRESSSYDIVWQRISRCASRRISWLRKLWMENSSSENTGNSFNQHVEVDGYLKNNDTCGAETIWLQGDETMQPLNNEIENLEYAISQDKSSRLARLRSLFGLKEIELDIIQCCLVLTIDPNMGRVYAYLQDHSARSYTSFQLVARLFRHGMYIVTGSSSPLMTWGLLHEIDMGRGEPTRLELDPYVRNWLLGSNDIDGNLSGISSLQTVHPALPHWPLTSIIQTITEALSANPQDLVRVFLSAPAGSGRRTLAALIARWMNAPLLVIRTQQSTATEWPQLYKNAQRQSLLGGYILLWEGQVALENHWPLLHQSPGLQFIIGNVDESPQEENHLVDIRIDVPPLPVGDAYLLWKRLLPKSAEWPVQELEQMTRRHQINIGQLMAVSKKNILSPAAASAALRSLSRNRLGHLATQVNSLFTWDDLIIPASLRNSLQHFLFEATEKTLVWEQPAMQRLFPQGRGIIALFTGTPGTGKTMAAQVIANSLQLDLFRVDLSSMVSKYIGETSKNIHRILSRAQHMDVVLLFDEADALFGTRTDIKDAHDRYANTDTNYLLQAIEEYPGIIILASNRKTGIDNAFTRRLRYVLDFPRPDKSERYLLWHNLIAELVSEENAASMQQELNTLAGVVEVTGAQIKLAVLSAIYIARRDHQPVSLIYLLMGLERELSKEERGLGKPGQELLRRCIQHNKLKNKFND